MNIWLFYAIVFVLSLAVLIAGFWKQNQVIAGTIAVLTVIFTRVIQVNNSYRGPGDSYYYWHVPEAILRNGGLSAGESATWYPGVEELMAFPTMHIMTSAAVNITGITDLTFARALLPGLYGGVFFIIVVALAHNVISREWAVVAAYTTVQADSMIFYQTEYHAQSFGLFFIGLLTLIFVWAIQSTNKTREFILFILASFGLVTSHRFSSIVAIVLFSLMVVGLGIYRYLPRTSISEVGLRKLARYMLFLGSLITFIHVLINTSVFNTSIAKTLLLFEGEILEFSGQGNGGTAETPTVVDRFGLYSKILLVVAATPTIIYSFLQDHDDRILTILAFLGAIGPTAILISVLSFGVLTRIILFAFVPLTLVAFYTFYEYVPVSNVKPLAAVFAITLIMFGVTAGTIPSLIDPSSDIRADGYQGVTPMSGHHEDGGDWIREYSTGGEIAVSRYTIHTVVTFGHHPIRDTVFIPDITDPPRYVVVDKEREEIPPMSRVYTNGRIVIAYQE